MRVPVLSLSGTRERHGAEFSVIGSIRELSGDRVLVTDVRERQLRSVRFSDNSSISIGRTGKGPKEFVWLGSLRTLSRDSTIFADAASRRWVLLDGEQILGSLPPDHPTVSGFRGLLDGADATGAVMLLPSAWPIRAESPGRVSDSSPVVLASRRGSAARVVTMLKRHPMERVGAAGRDWRQTGLVQRPIGSVLGMTEDETALLCADGRVAVARVQPFRVDVRLPNGSWQRGAPLAVPRLPVDGVERAAYLERTAAMYVSDYTRPKTSDFPSHLPVFAASSRPLSEAPDGALLVRRTTSARARGNHYLVIDRSLRLLGELVLPANQTIVGAGQRHVYIAETDDDDLQHLVRVRWTLVSADKAR